MRGKGFLSSFPSFPMMPIAPGHHVCVAAYDKMPVQRGMRETGMSACFLADEPLPPPHFSSFFRKTSEKRLD
jgi:hypothetical protein